MKRALILTADAGFGHRAAANAIADALKRYPDPAIEPTIVNLLDDPATPQWLRNTQSDFDKIVRDVPGFYEVAYDQSDKAGPTTQIMSVRRIIQSITEQRPTPRLPPPCRRGRK